MFGVRSLFLAALLFSLCLGHGALITPAMRANPSVNGGWCPWCQGDQIECSNKLFCAPPSPCWGAPGPTTVKANVFSGFSGLKDNHGDFWIDQTGGDDAKPIWCPSETISYNVLLYADHNGIFQFQTMPGKPGQEKEDLFKPITGWKSINNDNATTYYDTDGITPLKPGICKGGIPWSPQVGHCRDFTFYKSSFTLPASLPPGDTIFRWVWYGAMTVDGQPVVGPEKSLFVNCKDVTIGTPQQCNRIV